MRGLTLKSIPKILLDILKGERFWGGGAEGDVPGRRRMLVNATNKALVSVTLRRRQSRARGTEPQAETTTL